MNKQTFSFKRILIINIFGIGDVLFTTPLISNIKEAIPDAFIGYVCNRRTASVLKNNPKVNKVFIYEKDEYADASRQSKTLFLRQVKAALAEIKDEKFDVCLDLSLNKYAHFFIWLIGIKHRVGFNYKNRSPLLTTKINLKGYEGKHVVDYYLSLLEALNVPIYQKEIELFTSEEEKKWANDWFNKQNVKSQDVLIGLVPGGGASWGKDAPYKRWPAEKFAQLTDKIVEKSKAKIILMGDARENDLCAAIAEKTKSIPLNACGQTTIGQMASLLSKCRLAIVNDGGPLHMAVASGVQTISIFGPVDENVYGPYPKDKHVVITQNIACRPCYRRFKRADCSHVNCLRTIAVNDILKEIERIL